MPEKISTQSHFSQQRIPGIAHKPAKDLWDCPQAGRCAQKDSGARFFSRLIFVVGVSPDFPFAIDRAKWNIPLYWAPEEIR